MSKVESAKWSIHGIVEKFEVGDDSELGELSGSELLLRGLKPLEVVEFDGNLLVNAGAARLMDLLIGAGGTAYANGTCRIGVGDTATAATAADTDLGAASGGTHRQFVVTDSTFPSRSGQTITFKSTFTTGLANFAWAEWGIDNGTTNGTTVVATFLNHKITSLGTKTSSASWAFSVTLVVS